MQLEVMHESIEDAIRETARVCGGNKALADFIYGHTLSPAAAYSRFMDCLNMDRAAKFSPSELTAIAREGNKRGCHGVMHFIAIDAGYEAPTPSNVGKLIDKAQQEIAKGVKFLQQNMEILKRLGG